MNPVWILLLATFAAAQVNDPFVQCNTELYVKPASISYGSLNGFYSIAKGISDELQKKLPDQAIQQIYDFITGVGSVDTGTVIDDVVKSQAGAIAFFCVGLLIILISLVLGFVTCCCRNYCSGCGASKEQDADASKIPLLLMFLLMLACFSFILTGIIIFNQSASNMFGVVDQSSNLIDGVVTILNQTLLNGTGQITCVVNNSVDTTFNQAETNMQAYPVNIFALFYSLTGVTVFQQVNMTGISDGIQLAQTLSQDALTSLGNIQGCNYDDIQKQLQLTNAAMIAANTNFAPNAVLINNGFKQIMEASNGVESTMNTTIEQVIASMTEVEGQVNQISGQVNTALATTMDMVYNIQNALNSAQHDIVTWSGYKSVQGGYRAVMTVPNAIALLFLTVISLAVLYRLFMRNDPQNRSFPSRALGCFAVVGFYVLIFFTWLAMAVASATFVGGWAISGVCEPMFQDNTFAAYGVLNQLVVTIPGLNGTSSNVTTQSLFQNCYQDQTIFKALGGSNLLNPSMIMSMINFTQYETEIETLVNDIGNEVNIPNNPVVLDAVNGLQSSVQSQADAYNKSGGNYFPGCTTTDATQNATKIIDQLTAVLNYLTVQINLLQTAVQQSQTAATNTSIFTTPMLNMTNESINDMNTLIETGLNQLMTQLNDNAFKCKPLYTVYENAGFIMCDQFGRPVHGLWASAGLAALFFIPAAFALLYASTWLFKMKYGRRSSQLNTDERQPKASKKDKNASAPWEDDEVFMKPSIYDNTARGNQIAPIMMAAPATRSDIYLERPNPERQTSYGLPRASEAWGVDDEVSNTGSGLRRLGQPQMSYDSSRPSGLTRTNDSFEAPTASSSQLRRF